MNLHAQWFNPESESGPVGKVAMQRSDVQGGDRPSARRVSMPGTAHRTRAIWSLCLQDQIEKAPAQNHKGEDEAVFPEEK